MSGAALSDVGRLRLDGRVVLVTGASSGLGAAYARALAEAGARLVLVSRRREALERVASDLGCVAVRGDVGDPATADAAVEAALSSYGRVDVLVNNAGPVRDRTLLKMTNSEFDDVVRAHTYGSFYMGRACARAMRESGSRGMIVNVGSDSGLVGAFGQTNYAAAKGAILGITLTWAQELRRFGISANCVLPNALTAMTANLPDLLARYRYAPTSAGFPRAMGGPNECAPLVVLLASERWQHLNGLLLSLGGDRLSLWEPPAETHTAFLHGGWSVEELDRSLEFAVGLDLTRASTNNRESNEGVRN
jgi:NAD(P)-dependent dehydrogenase (short-subunit alcohol dehydrogenase family)